MANRRRGNGQGSLYKRNGAKPYRMTWYDYAGKRHDCSTGTTDKAAAVRILNNKVTEVALRQEGVVDASKDSFVKAGQKPLKEHIAD